MTDKRHEVISSVATGPADAQPGDKKKLTITVVEGDMSSADAAQRQIDAVKITLAGLIAYWRTQGLTIDDDGTVQGASPSLPA